MDIWGKILDGIAVAQVGIWITIAIMVLTGLVKIWPVLSAFVKITNSVKELPGFMETTSGKIDDIRHEVRYNNGSSIKDATKRTERSVDDLHKKLDGVSGEITTLKEREREANETAAARLARLEKVEANTLTPQEKAELKIWLVNRNRK